MSVAPSNRLSQREAPPDSRWRQWNRYPHIWVSDHNQIFNMKTQRLHALFVNNTNVLCFRIFVDRKQITRSVDKLRRYLFHDEKVKSTAFYLIPQRATLDVWFMCSECQEKCLESTLYAHAMMKHRSQRVEMFSSGDGIKEKTDDY